jgi:outer membrane protein insertion porin family
MRKRFTLALLSTVVGLLFISPGLEAEPVKWSIKGAGFFRDRALKRQIQTVFPAQGILDSKDVEDAVLILLSLLQKDGFLNARIETRLFAPEVNTPVLLDWSLTHETILEESEGYSRIDFRIHPGPVFHYADLAVEASGGLSSDWIEGFYFPPVLLFQGAKSRIFSHEALERSSQNLETFLYQQGFQATRVTNRISEIDFSTGAVSVVVSIDRGLLHRLVDVQWDNEDEALKNFDLDPFLDQPYSRELRQDLVQQVRNQLFERGYADSIIHTRILRETTEDEVEMRIVLNVENLQQIKTGNISFAGANRTRYSFLKSKLLIQEGDYLNPVLVDQSRMRLSQTGLFSQVRVLSEHTDSTRRDLQFHLTERNPWTVDLMAGWGTWEMARGGVMIERNNLWGVAQQVRLSGIVSMKSLITESRYLIPDVWSSGTAITSRLFTLDRQEYSFNRIERGFDIAVTRRFERARLDSALLYTLEILRSEERQDREIRELEKSQSASISLKLSHDARDSPILPRHGYRIYGSAEWASDLFGGDTNYQVIEIGFGQHHHMGSGLYWHLGLNQGAVSTETSGQRFIPRNKLFFPGGDNSVRGYQRGQAAPRDAEGFLIGARSYSSLNFELEQYLSKNVSIVAFYDWAGVNTGSRIFKYSERLDSIGLGLRLRTPMGPLRLEYGHNLRQRDRDPKGTLHFALGFPF